MSGLPAFKTVPRSLSYSVVGTCLGLFAPVGWIGVRLLFFHDPNLGLLDEIVDHIFSSGEQLFLHLYMGLGTAAVFGVFGYFIGKSSQALQERAESLDLLHREVDEQRRSFEQRFVTLNSNLKNFHATSARIQCSIDSREVINLAAESLHEILGYDRVNVLMVSADGTQLEFAATRGTGGDTPKGCFLPLDERAGVLYQTVVNNRVVLVEDMHSAPREFQLLPPCNEIKQLRSRSFIICPIAIGGKVVGLFGVDNKTSHRPLNETDVDTVRLFADQVASLLNRIRLLQGVERLTGELITTFSEVAQFRNRHGELLAELRGASTATTQTVARIAEGAEVISTVVEDTVSATTEISSAVDEVTHSLDKLQQFIEQSISAMTEIAATVRQVEKNATLSLNMAETVRGNAEAGARTVSQAFHGLDGISRAVAETSAVIEALSRRGEEINRIIDVINSINQKTNLLSLNAAIIAAQAGEYGRPFAVVADEIRNLSLETIQSASAIDALVLEIQDHTRQAVYQIGETRRLVDEDVVLGRSTDQALQQILDSSSEAMAMAADIRQATAEQVRSSQFVSRSIEELGTMATRLVHASKEQSQGLRRIVQSVAEIKAMADDVAGATFRQRDASQRIDGDVEQIERMSQHIFEVLEERQQESYRVIEQLDAVKGGH